MSALVITIGLFMMGAAVGSFLNVVVHRSINGEDWVWTRSRCDNCKKQIKWFDNIPLFSYLVLRGKCRFCKQQIALSHPVMELLTALLFVWWYWGGFLFFQLSHSPFTVLQPLFWLSVGLILLAILLADSIYMIIPDFLVGLLLSAVVLYRVVLVGAGIMQTQDLLRSFLGVLIGVAIIGGLWLLTKGKGMGFGDVKLIVPLALLLGWPQVLVGIFLSFVLGAVFGLGLIISKRKKFGQVIPFGPFMIGATFISLIWGDYLFNWYMSLLLM
jgi:prepilin signal peptidase PulO-like enzyme (type II secretory pathway)